MFFKRNRDFIIFGAILFAFTGYVLLDTFVIPRSYEAASQDGDTGTTATSEYVEERTGEKDTTENDAASGNNAQNGSDAAPGRGNGGRSGKGPGKHKRSSSDSTDATTENSNNKSGSDSEKGTSEKSSDSDAETVKQDLNLSGGTVVDTYTSGGNTITLYEYRVEDTEIYVADVVLQSAGALQTAFADQTYGKNITAKTSEIASDNNAVLAINGDFYGARENGYVIRNGKLYRDTSAGNQEDLVIYEDGSFEIINESTITATELLEKGAKQVLSFGPALLQNGQVAVSADEEVGKAMASNPRTAVGIVDSLHYVFVVSDGRTQDSEGLSLSELASFMKTLGVTTAYNLDGGGSSTMYFNGEVVNNPTTSGKNIKERSVSDIVYIQ